MERQRTSEQAEQDDTDDRGIMWPLLNDEDHRPWSVAELIRDHGDEITAVDAIERLARSGLVHRTSDDLVYPTRAALHMHRIKP